MLEFSLGVAAVLFAYSLWAVWGQQRLKQSMLTAFIGHTDSVSEATFMLDTFWDEIVLAHARQHPHAQIVSTIIKTADLILEMDGATGGARVSPADKRAAIKDAIRDSLRLPAAR